MKKNLIFPVFMLIASLGFSQNKGVTLNEKWNNMMTKSENYQFYKVIKKDDLNEIWKSVQDSSSKLKQQLGQERSTIKQQEVQIATLQKKVEELNGNLETVTGQKDSMGFLGMSIDKYVYATLLWILIFLIAGGCGVLFFLFRNSNKVTVQKTSDYDNLSKSFEEYKQGKIEMERKLKREIQTQMNKIEELKKR